MYVARPAARLRPKSLRDRRNHFPVGTFGALKGSPVKHVEHELAELRRYIAASEARADMEEVDTLLAVALEELRRRITRKKKAGYLLPISRI